MLPFERKASPSCMRRASVVNGPDTGRGLIFALDGGILDETRQTLARLFDLAPVTRPPQGWSCRIFDTKTSTQWGRSSSKYLSLFARSTFGIARVDGFQVGAQKLADHYSIARCDALYEPTGLSVGELQSRFQTVGDDRQLLTVKNFHLGSESYRPRRVEYGLISGSCWPRAPKGQLEERGGIFAGICGRPFPSDCPRPRNFSRPLLHPERVIAATTVNGEARGVAYRVAPHSSD